MVSNFKVFNFKNTSVDLSFNDRSHEFVKLAMYTFILTDASLLKLFRFNRMSIHETNTWRKAISRILTRLGWFDPPMGRVDQPK